MGDTLGEKAYVESKKNAALLAGKASTESLNQVSSGLAEITSPNTVTGVGNTFTIDLSKGLNHSITISDANAKTFALSNVPVVWPWSKPLVIQLNITVLAAIIGFNGIVWANGVIPTYAAGKTCYLYFFPVNNGASFHGSKGSGEHAIS